MIKPLWGCFDRVIAADAGTDPSNLYAFEFEFGNDALTTLFRHNCYRFQLQLVRQSTSFAQMKNHECIYPVSLLRSWSK